MGRRRAASLLLPPVEHEPERERRPKRWLLAAATASAMAIVLHSRKSASPALTVALVLLATAGSLELARREAQDPSDPRPIAWTTAALFSFAVVQPIRFATDIWSYTMVGRTVSTHHLSPYRIAPAALPLDPLLGLVHHTWRTGTTPYGPLFVLHAAFVTLVSGAHPLLLRLGFQLTAAVAIGIALRLLWRETHSTAALALVGLNPEIVGSIVNAGHNDALLALGVLGVVLLLARGRIGLAGVVLAAAVLVKLSIGFVIIPLAVWTAVHYRRRGLVRFLAPTALVAAPILLLIPRAVHTMTHANDGVLTRLSLWNVPFRTPWFGLTRLPAVTFINLGLLAALAIACFAAWATRADTDAGRGAALAGAGWLIAAGYVLAWYTVLGLVVAALRPRERIARWLAAQGGIITAAFLIPRKSLTTVPLLGFTVWIVVPLALGLGFVWAVAPLFKPASAPIRA